MVLNPSDLPSEARFVQCVRYSQMQSEQQSDRMVTATVKMLLLSVIIILCLGNYALGKDRGEELEKQRAKESADSSRKDAILTMEWALLRYTNAERGRRNLPSLQMSKGLLFLAKKQSNDMCKTRTLQHESEKFPRGWRKFSERLRIIGVKSGGENIAYRTMSERPQLWAREVVKGWMNSADHKKNILNPGFRYVGIGVFPCTDRIVYAAQVFSEEPGRVPQTPE